VRAPNFCETRRDLFCAEARIRAYGSRMARVWHLYRTRMARVWQMYRHKVGR